MKIGSRRILFVGWQYSQLLVSSSSWRGNLQTPNPIVNLRVLKDRNLAIGVILNLSVGAVLYATTAVIPQFLQLFLGYTSYEAGFVMSPRGIEAVIGSIVAGRMLAKLDGRLWMVQGAGVFGLTMFLLGGIDLAISPGRRFLAHHY